MMVAPLDDRLATRSQLAVPIVRNPYYPLGEQIKTSLGAKGDVSTVGDEYLRPITYNTELPPLGVSKAIWVNVQKRVEQNIKLVERQLLLLQTVQRSIYQLNNELSLIKQDGDERHREVMQRLDKLQDAIDGLDDKFDKDCRDRKRLHG
jgi:hypothetical protein